MKEAFWHLGSEETLTPSAEIPKEEFLLTGDQENAKIIQNKHWIWSEGYVVLRIICRCNAMQ